MGALAILKLVWGGSVTFVKKTWPVLVLLAVFFAGGYFGRERGYGASAEEIGNLKGRVSELEGENNGLQTSCASLIAAAELKRDEAVRKANKWSSKVNQQSEAFRRLEAERMHALTVLQARLAEESEAAHRYREAAAELEAALIRGENRSVPTAIRTAFEGLSPLIEQ